MLQNGISNEYAILRSLRIVQIKLNKFNKPKKEMLQHGLVRDQVWIPPI